MLKLTIEIRGKRRKDLDKGLREVKRLFDEGFRERMGYDFRESTFEFQVTRERKKKP